MYIHLVYTLWDSLYQIERLLSTLETHGVWKSTGTHRPVGVNVLFQTSLGRRYGHLFFIEYALVANPVYSCMYIYIYVCISFYKEMIDAQHFVFQSIVPIEQNGSRVIQ